MTETASRPARRGGRALEPRVIAWIVSLAASMLSIAMRMHVPVTMGGAVVDDQTYLRGAWYLANGQWLGPFDQYTLLKGPAYPMFVAAMYRSGVPLKLGEQLIWLAAAGALAASVWVVTRRLVLSAAAYAVVALDPANFDTWASRVTRDSWYSALTLLLVAAVFLAIFAAITRARVRRVILLAVLSGATAGAFWLCREEGPWIVPSLLVLFVGLPSCLVVRWWFRRPRQPVARERVVRVFGRLALVAVTTAVLGAVLVAAVASMNGRQYGAPLTDDLVDGSFARAYADWRRVDGAASTAEDPITRAQREAVYNVGPVARSLQPLLDPVDGCHVPLVETSGFDSNIPPCHHPVWRGLRDAAAAMGYYGNGADAQRFFQTLDDEIVAGCDSGQLRCSPRLPSQLQSLQIFSAGPFLHAMRTWGAGLVTSSGYYDLPPGFRSGPGGDLRRTPIVEIVRGVPRGTAEAEAQLAEFQSNAWPYRLLARLYTVGLPIVLVAALVGMLVPLVRPRWPAAALSVLSLSLGVGFVVRLAFVALLQVTQFDVGSLATRYLLPAHALLLAFAVVGSSQLIDAMRSRVRIRGAHAPARTGGLRRLVPDPSAIASATDPAPSSYTTSARASRRARRTTALPSVNPY